ncbi:MAG: NAD(P)-binding protein [Ilumatobacteraceae bacterium]
MAVIGAGMAGILAAIELRRRGVECVVFEKADRVGGTWRENTYPGLSCDVPAHSYTYTFARNPDWSRWYADGAEIQRYFERVADEHGVLALVRFGDEVTGLEFVDGGWNLRTASGHADRFEAVIAATGCCTTRTWPASTASTPSPVHPSTRHAGITTCHSTVAASA